MSESIVQKKIAKLIQKELSEILRRGGYIVGGMITVSVVRMTADLSLAKIYITVFPDNQLNTIVNELNERAWEIRKQLGARIKNKMRKMPDIRFYVDDSFVEAEKIDRLLKKVKENNESEINE